LQANGRFTTAAVVKIEAVTPVTQDSVVVSVISTCGMERTASFRIKEETTGKKFRVKYKDRKK
jgi:tartrate dehydratase alpha subunit/fumarate hydratase class I-like protein